MRGVLVAIIFVFSSSAHSDDLDRLVSLLGLEQMMEKAGEDCRLKAEQSMNSDAGLEKYGRKLQITPQHELWGELKGIFEGYVERACNYVSVDEVKRIWRETYEKGFSSEEISELVKFFSTPLGRKTIEVDLQANAEFQSVVGERYAEKMAEASRNFKCQLSRLARKIEEKKHNK